MYILRCEPSGLGNVFLDCQQVSDQPHAGLQGNSPPGNKTHTQGEKKPTKPTCTEHKILTEAQGFFLLLYLPNKSSQQQPLQRIKENAPQ